MHVNSGNGNGSVVFGDYVVWEQSVGMSYGSDIDFYIISRNYSNLLAVNHNVSDIYPAIHDDRIVWSTQDSNGKGAMVKDLSTLTTKDISYNGSYTSPDIYESYVVLRGFLGSAGYDHELYLMDLNTCLE